MLPLKKKQKHKNPCTCRSALKQEVGGTWNNVQKHENENQKGLLEMVSGGLMAPEEANSKGCQASEPKSPKTWMKGDCCYEAAEGKIDEKNKLKKDN